MTWRKHTTVILALMLIGAAAVDAVGRLGSFLRRTERHEPLDLSVDLYHRIKAGLFRPDSEPLVFDSSHPALYWQTPSGAFTISAGSHGDDRRVWMDWEAASSHHRVRTPNGGCPTRSFRQ